jgi:hypothetical protein
MAYSELLARGVRSTEGAVARVVVHSPQFGVEWQYEWSPSTLLHLQRYGVVVCVAPTRPCGTMISQTMRCVARRQARKLL